MGGNCPAGRVGPATEEEGNIVDRKNRNLPEARLTPTREMERPSVPRKEREEGGKSFGLR